jgi:hypothetical protein
MVVWRGRADRRTDVTGAFAGDERKIQPSACRAWYDGWVPRIVLTLSVAALACCGTGSDPADGGTPGTSGSSEADGGPSTAPGPGPGPDDDGDATSSAPAATTSAAGTDTSGAMASTGGDATGEDATGVSSRCDYEAVDGMIVIEAENLPITEDWAIQTAEPGYSGDGYIVWTRGSNNGDPTHGVLEVTIHVSEPGRYRLRWRNRIGMGTNTTEHNDTWAKFPDAAAYYGLQMAGADELRRYPRPTCEDADAMAAVEALPQVAAAECVEGSSLDDWFKVYSSGASDWSWSTRTNDNDAFDVMVELDSPGDYTFAMAARADWHLVDRIVIHQEGLDDAVVESLDVPETPCAP